MSNRPGADPIHPALRNAEAEAARHLEEACDDIQKDLSQESLDELLRLEEELLAAARAVDETVRLRRQLGERPATAASAQPTPSTQVTQPTQDVPVCRLRDFLDAQGKEWRAWEVRPGSSGRRINPERYLGEYVKGWLAFECPSDEVRKRLPNHPANWFEMTDPDLSALLPQALDVLKRGRGSATGPEAM
jgi:hypothetical protein